MTADVKKELVEGLIRALREHAETYPHGDWKKANEKISNFRDRIDEEWHLNTAGELGNEKLLRILRY